MFLISSSSCLMRTSLWLRSSLSRLISSCCLWNFNRSCGQTHARDKELNHGSCAHWRLEHVCLTFRLQVQLNVSTANCCRQGKTSLEWRKTITSDTFTVKWGFNAAGVQFSTCFYPVFIIKDVTETCRI